MPASFLTKKTLLVLILMLYPLSATSMDDGEDVLYAVKAMPGSVQDWGTIAPSTGNFTKITQISPTGLGWPLGDIGSEPDPINGYVYTRQTNTGSGATDVLAIKKSDGSTKWLGIGANGLVVGYDTKTNKLIYRVSESSSNTLKTYDMVTTETGTIGTFGGSSTSWQAGGIGAVDSYSRTAFQLRPNSTSTLYKVNLDDGTETTVSINKNITTIAWDSKNQKLYGLYSPGGSGFRVAEINTTDGTITDLSSSNNIGGMSNYVQLIAPNDQRYYVQQSDGNIIAISLSDGTSLGTFAAPLRIMPPGAVVIGDASTDETVSFDISSPDSKLIKLGNNDVTYTGTNSSVGGVDIESGTLKVAGSTNLGSGSVSLEGGELELSANAEITNSVSSSNDDSAIDTSSNSVQISGAISGTKEINKKGTGTLTLTGSLNNTGGIDVQSGSLVANGTGTTPVTVTSGTLGGAGTIGNLVSSGTVAPGNSIGTLNVSGSVMLNSGSVLVIEVDANGNSDKIVATGAVTAGGTLRISPESGSYTDGQQYTIITGSSVSGTFANVSVLSCSGTATPTYGSTSITFSLSNCSVSRPTNVSTIISYINDLDTSSSADLQSVVTALNNLTGTEYEAAVATLDANSQTNVRASSVQQISTINSLINQRASGGLDNVTNIASLFSGADTQSNLAITTRGDEHALARSNEPWIKTFIANSKQKDDTKAGINGYDFQAGGFVIGYDVRKNKNLQGLAFSYIDGKTTSNNSEGSSDQKTMVLSGYRVNELGNGSMLSTSLSLVLNDITSSRKIAFTGINKTASANYDALGFDVSTSYTSAPKQRYGGDASTEISFGVFSSQNDAYTETGAGAANLTVDSFASTMGRLGVKEKIVWKDGFDWLSDATPYASFGINVSSELTAGTASQALSGQSKFVSKTDNGANTDIELGVGFNKKFQNNGVLSSGVTARVGSGFNSQEANLTYRWQF